MAHYVLPPDIARSFSDITNRVSALERTRTIATVTTDPITTPAPVDGATVVNKTNGKLWIAYGGAWHSATLT